MSISGLGSVTGTSGTTCDFTNMTNSQAMAAAKALGGEGKISPQAQAQINYFASGANMIEINPATGAYDPVAQASMVAARLSSTTPSNFEDTFKGLIADENCFHETKAAAMDTEVLQDTEKYSSNAGSASVAPTAAGASGTQYDFTQMTNAQLLTATSALYASGSLTQSEAATLSAKAQGVDNANPTNPQSVAQIVSDPTPRNVLGLLQMQYDLASAHPADNTGNGSAAQLSSLIQALTKYQTGDSTGSSAANQSTIGGIISTTA